MGERRQLFARVLRSPAGGIFRLGTPLTTHRREASTDGARPGDHCTEFVRVPGWTAGSRALPDPGVADRYLDGDCPLRLGTRTLQDPPVSAGVPGAHGSAAGDRLQPDRPSTPDLRV